MRRKYEHIGKVVKINIKGLRRQWSSSWSNSASEHARDFILVSTGIVLLDLLQPVQPVLEVQVNLRLLEMVPNDSPYPKTWGLAKNQVSKMLLSRVTLRSGP